MAKAEKLPRFATPKGTLKFPWLQVPSTTFNADGVYQTKLLLTEEQAKPLIEMINKMTEEHFNNIYNEAKKKDKDRLSKQYPYGPEYLEDEDGEEVESELLEFKFKKAAKVTSAKDGKVYEFTVPCYDARNNPVPKDRIIYSGSTAIINFSPRTYFVAATGVCGITLQLNAVQVHSFGQGGASPSQYGFVADPNALEDEPEDSLNEEQPDF